ncbi:alanine--tRNA ligase [Patescibacteria group bacterium]|nr:alanine--tRNA ligase [Patescibacteria group bacterium]
MTAQELKEKFISFFVKKRHKKLPNVSLVPENDPTALFINSGMHPLVPYLLGEPHPLGKRLVSNQRCLRTQDIDEVRNMMHLTFFEMLGNWSLGDYWKKEAIEWSWEFLIKELRLEPKRISVTCFAGDKDTPKDEEAAKVWQKIGIPKQRIYFLGKKDNWWAVGETGPCGPDTEMFYDTGKKKCGPKCRPGDNCGKYFEMWNDVFMEFDRLPNGKLEKLKQQNIDTGMGVERTTAMLQGKDDVYQTELFTSITQTIEKISGKKYQGKNKKSMRIIADHLRAASFAIGDGVMSSNVEAGYIVRRLIRRAVRYGRPLQINKPFLAKIAEEIIDQYSGEYFHLKKNKSKIIRELSAEEERFNKSLERGLREIEKYKVLNGKSAFYLYETYGFPLEMTQEIAQERGQKIKKGVFEKEFKKHQELSKKGVETKFAGGLADHSEEVTKLHTTTHLLHQALRDVLGDHVQQVGSNITPKRLRFDFTHPEKLTEAQMKKVEKIMNEKIKANLLVKIKTMTLAEAKKKGALAFFGEKYSDKVKVYMIGGYSQEVCGGPHVKSTKEIGRVKIIKEKAVGAGRRRIYAQLAHGS